MTTWMANYDAATAELKEAEAQHKTVMLIYAESEARLDRARREVVRLYQERMNSADGVSAKSTEGGK